MRRLNIIITMVWCMICCWNDDYHVLVLVTNCWHGHISTWPFSNEKKWRWQKRSIFHLKQPLDWKGQKSKKQNPDLDYTGNRIHLVLNGIAKLNISQSKSFIFSFIQSYSKSFRARRVLCLEWCIWRVPHISLLSHGKKLVQWWLVTVCQIK